MIIVLIHSLPRRTVLYILTVCIDVQADQSVRLSRSVFGCVSVVRHYTLYPSGCPDADANDNEKDSHSDQEVNEVNPGKGGAGGGTMQRTAR